MSLANPGLILEYACVIGEEKDLLMEKPVVKSSACLKKNNMAHILQIPDHNSKFLKSQVWSFLNNCSTFLPVCPQNSSEGVHVLSVAGVQDGACATPVIDLP